MFDVVARECVAGDSEGGDADRCARGEVFSRLGKAREPFALRCGGDSSWVQKGGHGWWGHKCAI